MDSEAQKQLVIDALDELKAVNTVSLDVTGMTDVMDFLVIASGTSNRHVKSLADNVCMQAKKQGLRPLGVEGEDTGEWVLVDFGDVVVHVMLPATRDFYDLERLWRHDTPCLMRISVIAVGSKMPAWVEQGVDDYCRRLPRELKLQWREIPLARRTRDARPEQLAELEGEQILKAVPAGDRVIALDVLGKRLSTHDLAGELRAWQMSGNNFSLLIGGPDGLAPQCLQRADSRWSLSDLTLPHPLVRVILAEQLYRAWTITVNHPYHRD